MKIREMEDALLKELDTRLGAHGYVRRARDQSFYKRTPFGRLALHVSLIKHQADFDVTADVAVRFDDLEDLLNQPRQELSNAETPGAASPRVSLT